MKKWHAICLGLFIFLSGCTTVPAGPVIGSQSWYDGKIQEIDQAYVQGKLTKEQQLNLKNETDKVRMTYENEETRRMDRQMRWNNSFHRHYP